jgi:hypothetical protein
MLKKIILSIIVCGIAFPLLADDPLSESDAQQAVNAVKQEIEASYAARKQGLASVSLLDKDTSIFDYKLAPSFTFSQSYYTPSWQDGIDAVGYRTAVFGYSTYVYKKFFIRFAADIAYARATEENLSPNEDNPDASISRKKEDRISLNLSAGRRLHSKYKLYVSGLIDLKTQFGEGEGQLVTGKTGRVSDFFAPAYVIGTVGLRYETAIGLNLTAAPLSGRFTFVKDTSLSRYVGGMYEEEDDKPLAFKQELGAYVEFTYEYKANKNLLIISKLEMFSNYQDNPQNIDVDWSTTLDFKISKWFSVIFFNRIIYRDKSRYYLVDPDTKVATLHGPNVQWNESVNIGLSYTFGK